ncbi:hypothetical protein [Leptospira ilyithenensis]|uniref:Uncharacterized protein n=1 Tax=Leptospira ilyithenensis TaxID=2484901 RepID=A0A4R9LL81_9LEPT|nr:hypothetical protein [Leptospira ilyithenensis]TGN08312.1 hypothetical protein EHS11_15490 [Leptospira ilyithenensis]
MNRKSFVLTIFTILCVGSFSGYAESSVDRDFFQTEINWYELTVTAKINEPLPKIVFDEDDPDFGKPGTATNKGRSDLLARKKAKEKLRMRLSQRIESLFLNSDYTLFEYSGSNPSVRTRINSFISEEKETYDFQPKKNILESKASLHLATKQGLLAYLPMEYGTEEIPVFNESVLPVAFSGLVVDARHLDLRQSLFPKIQSDRGLDIYSPVYVKESYAIETGYVIYRTDNNERYLEKRVGKNPFFVLALGLAGKNQTDLILPSDEVAKLLSHPDSRKNLTRCKVMILVSK